MSAKKKNQSAVKRKKTATVTPTKNKTATATVSKVVKKAPVRVKKAVQKTTVVASFASRRVWPD